MPKLYYTYQTDGPNKHLHKLSYQCNKITLLHGFNCVYTTSVLLTSTLWWELYIYIKNNNNNFFLKKKEEKGHNSWE